MILADMLFHLPRLPNLELEQCKQGHPRRCSWKLSRLHRLPIVAFELELLQ